MAACIWIHYHDDAHVEGSSFLNEGAPPDRRPVHLCACCCLSQRYPQTCCPQSWLSQITFESGCHSPLSHGAARRWCQLALRLSSSFLCCSNFGPGGEPPCTGPPLPSQVRVRSLESRPLTGSASVFRLALTGRLAGRHWHGPGPLDFAESAQ